MQESFENLFIFVNNTLFVGRILFVYMQNAEFAVKFEAFARYWGENEPFLKGF